jgi:hypothetical protein
MYLHEAEWTPFQTHYLSAILVAPGIEPGTSRSAARSCDRYTKDAVEVVLLLTEYFPSPYFLPDTEAPKADLLTLSAGRRLGSYSIKITKATFLD